MSLQLGRPQVENKRSFQLTEDVLLASQAVLLIAKVMISTAQVHFILASFGCSYLTFIHVCPESCVPFP